MVMLKRLKLSSGSIPSSVAKSKRSTKTPNALRGTKKAIDRAKKAANARWLKAANTDKAVDDVAAAATNLRKKLEVVAAVSGEPLPKVVETLKEESMEMIFGPG
jgi:hypothetical protein